METENKTCCVFGHRKVTGKEDLKIKLTQIIERLIACDNVDTFLFGSRSEFDDLCREVISERKEKHKHIKRIYVRAEYPDIDEAYEKYLLQRCEKTYFPERARNAGRAVYIERNYEMINNSEICLVYYKDGYLPPERKNSNRDLVSYQPNSGTYMAYRYAVLKKRKIINTADNI